VPIRPDSDIYTLDDEESDPDLALERAANTFLSDVFGIQLSRLVRPIRVLAAFEEVKEQCATLLEEEGQYVGSEAASPESGSSTPCDAPEGARFSTSASGHSHALLQPQSKEGSGARGSKRKGDDDDGGGGGPGGGGSGSDPPEGSREPGGPNKKTCRERLPCPFRKRNPLRFNVRDYHACAAKSFDMSELK